MTTIRDVAAAAGVSRATAARVLANPEMVAEATRARVMKSVEELGYTRNSVAASLRTTRTGRIIVTVPDISNPFFSRVIRGVEEAAQKAGYAVLLGDTRNEREREEQYAEMLNRREADGIIFLGHRLPTTLARLLDRDGARAPIVNGCEFTPSLGVSSAHIDNAGAAHEVMRTLYEMGHRDIALITGPDDSPLTRDRLIGARKAAEDRGAERPIVESGDFTIESGRRAGMSLLTRDRPPTAIFCFSDEMAIGALAAARSAGIACPHTISIVGFDDIQMARYVDPPLATVRQPMAEIGRRTVELLLDILNDRQDTPVSATLPHQLVVRESLGPGPHLVASNT
ncbi:LacI family DNA-binding transcriptional regulator [Sphingomonas oryzagri]|uniref:LacI family DNA-binding transcriptional regulator n=1 Tax=Sphingomonas oryzagri TaxID=3042314 RepID=A0ABT6MZD0_9SPHN|nr:LacI family DNA-binding transcriptional regulator [Sphingomonas oryzagri]MDH7638347.1 LacI family DNA-binding transcriptional regulator [Sphingomonas oryzagri]